MSVHISQSFQCHEIPQDGDGQYPIHVELPGVGTTIALALARNASGTWDLAVRASSGDTHRLQPAALQALLGIVFDIKESVPPAWREAMVMDIAHPSERLSGEEAKAVRVLHLRNVPMDCLFKVADCATRQAAGPEDARAAYDAVASYVLGVQEGGRLRWEASWPFAAVNCVRRLAGFGDLPYTEELAAPSHEEETTPSVRSRMMGQLAGRLHSRTYG